ncbi:MAG: DUF1844 domain-containing protein [Verrucomicrobiota bacterium]
MNDPHTSPDSSFSMSPEEMRSALFAQMVMQQSSMAMMLMGQTAHPQTGEMVHDLEAARLFIDQLEMLAYKTKGNLTQEETALLQQNLMALRMAFVAAVDSPSAPAAARPNQSSAPPKPAPAGAPAPAEPAPATGPAADESRKKFTKKY